MEHPLITCHRCETPIPATAWNTPEPVACQTCANLAQVEVFPAVMRPLSIGSFGEPVPEGQASCFYHPQKKAEETCTQCGRFVCGLCDIEFSNTHVCPVCLSRSRFKGTFVELKTYQSRPDFIALLCAVLPILIFPFTLFTGPLALVLGIRALRTPALIFRRSKIPALLAILIAVLEILAWMGLIAVGMMGISEAIE